MSYWLFYIIGAALIGIDLMVISIYLSIIGLAAIETGVLVMLDLTQSPAIQIAIWAGLTLVNFFFLQKPLKKILKKEDEKIETFTTGGIGVIKDDLNGSFRVSYNGTTWAIDNLSQIPQLQENEEVIVKEIVKNRAIIEKK